MVAKVASWASVVGLDANKISESINNAVAKFSTGKASGSEATGIVARVFQWGIAIVILFFVKSCIEQFAQQRQKEIDDASVGKKDETKKSL